MNEQQLYAACSKAGDATIRSLRRSGVPQLGVLASIRLNIQHGLIRNLKEEVLPRPRNILPGLPGPYPLSDEELYKTDDVPFPWHFSNDMIERFSPLFDIVVGTNHGVEDMLKRHGVLDSECYPDSESSCLYVHFKTREAGRRFCKRLRAYLQIRKAAIKQLATV